MGSKVETYLGAFALENGIETCQVGYLPVDYAKERETLENRVVQVVDIYDDSPTFRKCAFAEHQEGLCHAVLIDRPSLKDDQLATISSGYYTDSSCEDVRTV